MNPSYRTTGARVGRPSGRIDTFTSKEASS